MSGHFQGLAVVPQGTKDDTTKQEAGGGGFQGQSGCFGRENNLLPSPVKQLEPLVKLDNETNRLISH